MSVKIPFTSLTSLLVNPERDDNPQFGKSFQNMIQIEWKNTQMQVKDMKLSERVQI